MRNREPDLGTGRRTYVTKLTDTKTVPGESPKKSRPPLLSGRPALHSTPETAQDSVEGFSGPNPRTPGSGLSPRPGEGRDRGSGTLLSCPSRPLEPRASVVVKTTNEPRFVHPEGGRHYEDHSPGPSSPLRSRRGPSGLLLRTNRDSGPGFGRSGSGRGCRHSSVPRDGRVGSVDGRTGVRRRWWTGGAESSHFP